MNWPNCASNRDDIPIAELVRRAVGIQTRGSRERRAGRQKQSNARRKRPHNTVSSRDLFAHRHLSHPSPPDLPLGIARHLSRVHLIFPALFASSASQAASSYPFRLVSTPQPAQTSACNLRITAEKTSTALVPLISKLPPLWARRPLSHSFASSSVRHRATNTALRHILAQVASVTPRQRRRRAITHWHLLQQRLDIVK